MSISWRMGVPVATPVTAADCIAAGRALLYSPVRAVSVEQEIAARIHVAYAHSANSGRSALYLLLTALKDGTRRNEVVIPAFVCPSVARAVIKAGLKPVVCDVGAYGSGLDPARLAECLTPCTLAVISAYLYGYPCPVDELAALTHEAGAKFIEDVAQAFGAKYEGRCVGALSDASIVSFGMSKVLWGISGGMVLTGDPEIQFRIKRVLAELPPSSALSQTLGVCKYTALAFLIRSHHLGPLAGIWRNRLRGADDCTDFEPGVLGESNREVIHRLLGRLDDLTLVRRANAEYYASNLTGLDGLVIPSSNASCEPVYLRFPIIIKDARVKSILLTRLHAVGVNASEMYTRESYDAIQGFAASPGVCPNAEYLCDRMLNVPTHPYVQSRDRQAAVSIIRTALAGQTGLPEPGTSHSSYSRREARAS